MMMKPLGSAVHEMEETIERIIRDAPLFGGGKGITYGPVSGGISNENWRVQSEDGGDWFVKVPGNGTEMFIDREAAMDASRKAAAAGLGPRVHDDLAHRGVEINDFLPDRRASTNSDFLDLGNCRAAIGAYRTMHGLPELGLTKTIFDMIDEHAGQIATLGGRKYREDSWLMLNTQLAKEAIEASGYDMVPSFNDPMPGNFMIAEDGSIMLIDYEYCSMNDRCYDLGIWFGEMFFTPDRELELIEEYFGEVRPEIVSRITVHKALADVKWALWSMVQLKISRLEFDFHKYGMWKKMRARSIMEDPDWALHLARL
ncbi:MULTISPECIES: phosphotransferase [unclassified Mameliella]|uniref:phosphotransferase n=1 Tax=unclassified Mameliella TaxID=2630630 RepID=UPI00273E9E3A|nr:MULTISPECIES: phosphotransferase [unclassified Mameliella]